METLNNDYYVQRKKKMMKFFDRITKKGSKKIDSRLIDNQGASIMNDIRLEYENLLLHIPYIGGIEPWTRQLLLTTIFLAVYKKMTNLGKSADESWEVCSVIIKARLNSLPRLLRKIIRNSVFTKRQMNNYRKQAEKSHEKIYPHGDVFNFIEGDGETFDYGIDIIECAKVKFLKEQNATEFMPYVCLVDKLWQRFLNMV